MFGDDKPPSLETKISIPTPLRRGQLDSPFACDVDYGDETAALSNSGVAPRLCWDAEVTPSLAMAIVEEAAANMTVPSATLVEALNLLRYVEDQELRRGAGGTDVRSLAGFWALCFRSGGVLNEAAADAHGYLSLEDRVDLRLNVRERGVALDTNVGLMPKTISGAFSYSPAGDALEARFDEVKLGPLTITREAAAFAYDLCRTPLRLRVFLATDKALGVVATFAGKSGVMLFRRESTQSADSSRIQANALKYAKKIMGLAKFDEVMSNGGSSSEALAASNAVAGSKKKSSKGLAAISAPEIPAQTPNNAAEEAENNAAEQQQQQLLQEQLRKGEWKMPERQDFGEYMNEEIHRIFLVVAGPTLLSFFKLYLPIATWKAGVAAAIIQDFMERSV